MKISKGDNLTKKENREVLLKNKKYFIIKFICSLALRAFLLAIPIYYSYGIDSIAKGNFNAAYHMIFMFFIFTVLYRISEIINQITYYKLYSNLYKSYLDLGLAKTCNNSLYSLSRFSLSEYSNIMSEDFETLSDYYATLVIRIVETNTERKNRHDKRISLFQELLLSVKEIKGFNIFNVAHDRTMDNIKDYTKWNNKLNIDKYNVKQVSLGLIDIFQVLCLVLGIKLISEGHLTIGVLTIIYNYYAKLNLLFTSIITLFESNINVKVARICK